MRSLAVLIFVFLLVGIVTAQEGVFIKGTVTDRNGPVAGATVTLVGKDRSDTRSTTSNDKGEYSVGIGPGEYTIVASITVGGRTRTSAPRPSVYYHDVQVLTIDIEISDVATINESVTVAAGQEQTIEQVSKSVDVIDGQEMRDRADFSLVESLRTIPGFRVQQSGGFGKLATIKTRGLRNSDTAVLIDGVRFRDPTAISGDATSFLSDITLTSVSEVEVLRGSGSSLYGTNAIGGVIDFQTPRAVVGTHGQIGGAFGGLGLSRFRGNISHGLESRKFGIGAGISRTVYSKGIDGNDDAHNKNFQTRFDASPGPKTSFSGKIFFSDANVKLNSDPDTAGVLPPTNATIIDANRGVNFTPDADDPDRVQKSRFFSGQFSGTQVLKSDLVLHGYYHGLSTKRRNDNGPLGAGFQSASTSIFDGQIHTGNAHLTWATGARNVPGTSNTLTGGYEFELEKFRNDGMTPSGAGNFFTTAGQRSHTFYAQDLVSLLDSHLQIAGGVRVQKYSLTRPGFSVANAPYSNLALEDPPTAVTFDGAVSYFLKRSGTKFRAHIGNGYRVPSLYERFGTFFSSVTKKFTAIGDPFLGPEKTIAYDAGVEQYAANDRVRLSATYFYTKLSNIIGYGDFAPAIGSTPRPFGGYENQKGGHAQGGEFSVKAAPSKNTDIFTSYTFTKSTQLTPQVFGSGVLKTLGVPDHQFTAVVTQRFGRAWVNFDFLATSTYLAPIFSNTVFDTYTYRFKGNRRGDVTGGYTFGFKKEKLSLRVYGTVENVFGQEYFENGFRTVGRTARAGTTFSF